MNFYRGIEKLQEEGRVRHKFMPSDAEEIECDMIYDWIFEGSGSLMVIPVLKWKGGFQLGPQSIMPPPNHPAIQKLIEDWDELNGNRFGLAKGKPGNAQKETHQGISKEGD